MKYVSYPKFSVEFNELGLKFGLFYPKFSVEFNELVQK